MSTAGPPQGAQHRSAQREGTPVNLARPPEEARTTGEAEGTPVKHRLHRVFHGRPALVALFTGHPCQGV
jgi:hypothetical protein